MKTILRIIALLALTISAIAFSAQAQDAEKQKIISIIKSEHESFSKKEKTKWQSHWSHTNSVRGTISSAHYFTEAVTWDSLSRRVNSYFDSNEPEYKAMQTDFHVLLYGDAAIAHLIEKTEKSEYVTTIILEKVKKEWKFVEQHLIQKSSFENTDVNMEESFNRLGYNLLEKSKVAEAIKVFAINTELFPSAWNTWDSLAEGFMVQGDKQKAIEYYEKSLLLNPKNEGAKKHLVELRK